MSTSGPIGEAPSLSPSYGQYDNGALVFNTYANFGGPSLPSGWATTGPMKSVLIMEQPLLMEEVDYYIIHMDHLPHLKYVIGMQISILLLPGVTWVLKHVFRLPVFRWSRLSIILHQNWIYLISLELVVLSLRYHLYLMSRMLTKFILYIVNSATSETIFLNYTQIYTASGLSNYPMNYLLIGWE